MKISDQYNQKSATTDQDELSDLAGLSEEDLAELAKDTGKPLKEASIGSRNGNGTQRPIGTALRQSINADGTKSSSPVVVMEELVSISDSNPKGTLRYMRDGTGIQDDIDRAQKNGDTQRLQSYLDARKMLDNAIFSGKFTQSTPITNVDEFSAEKSDAKQSVPVKSPHIDMSIR